MKNITLLILFSILPFFGFSQRLSVEIQGGAQVLNTVQDYYYNQSRLNTFENQSRFGMGLAYDLPKNFYTKLLVEYSRVDFRTAELVRIADFEDYSLFFEDYADSYRKQISSTLMLGFEIPKTWLFVEGGVSWLNNYEHDIASDLNENNFAGPEIPVSIENGTSTTIGYQLGFGIKADGRSFTSEKLNRYYLKYGHNFIWENKGNPTDNNLLELSTRGIIFTLTFGIRI